MYLQTIYRSNKIVEHFRGIMITDLDLSLNPDQPLEQINFGYSTKNIPTCSEKQYIKSLINRTEQFVKNVRWKAFFFLNPGLDIRNKETYAFNSTRPPPFIPELKEFEDGLTSIIEKIKFRKVNNTFQQKLRKDITKIKNDNHLLIPADKTNNYYKLNSEQYETLEKLFTTSSRRQTLINGKTQMML